MTFLTTSEIASMLRVSRNWVWAHAAKKRRPYAVFRGVIDEPKTKGSKSFVWLPKILQRDLEAFWRSLPSPDPADFIVSPAHGCVSRPLDTHNYLRRVFKPACEALGVKDVTHQCLRRTCSTYLLPHGTIKDVQGHLRHMSATTTLDIYAREIPESVKRAVEEMSRSMFPGQLDEEVKGRIN